MQAVEGYMKQLCPSWRVTSDGKAIERSFVAKNFKEALNAINGYGEAAERLGHHPDLHITSYRTVTIK